MVSGNLQDRAVLKGVLRTKDYILTKSPLVTNDMGNTPGKKGHCPRRVGYKIQRRGLLPASSAPYIKGLVSGLWSKRVEIVETYGSNR